MFTHRDIFRLICLCLMAALLAAPAEAAKKKKSEAESAPAYRQSGPIPGTPLTYHSLVVNKNGIAAVTIYNPSETGVSFSATFSFFDKKGTYLTGFSVKGFANRRTQTTHVEQLDYKLFKKAASVKVLGRGGRESEE